MGYFNKQQSLAPDPKLGPEVHLHQGTVFLTFVKNTLQLRILLCERSLRSPAVNSLMTEVAII